MNFYYDLLINLNEGEAYEFYEWMENDPIEHIKKIPIFRVKTKAIRDFLIYDISLNEDFKNSIYLKTSVSNNKLIKNIPYMFLLTDTKSTLIVEANSEGKVICLSKLLLNDDLDVLEVSFAFDEENISYERMGKKEVYNTLRIEQNIRQFLMCEIKTLHEKKIFDKLKYLYYEWVNETTDDIELIFKNLENLINGEFSSKHNEIYNLVKLSYQA